MMKIEQDIIHPLLHNLVKDLHQISIKYYHKEKGRDKNAQKIYTL